MLGLKILFPSFSLVLGNFHPDQIFYEKIDGGIKIEFREQKEKTESSDEQWMAFDNIPKDPKPVS